VKILLDENIPHDLRYHLNAHEVFTVAYLGWSGSKNGKLLQQAAANGFDVMVTMDDGVAYQHNLIKLPVSVCILHAPSNDLDDLLPLVPRLLERLASIAPCSVGRVLGGE
jgi:hypothetical protein